MSSEANAWGWKQELKGTTKLVLLRLCDWANGQSRACDASLSQLREAAGASKNPVISAIEHLIDEKYISKERQVRANGGYAKSRFVIHVDRPVGKLSEIIEAGQWTLPPSSETEQGGEAAAQIDPSSETEQGASSETEQGASSETDTTLVHTGEQGKELNGNVVTPQRPPKGGFSRIDMIDEFDPSDAWVRDVAMDAGVAPDMVRWMLPQWQAVEKDSESRSENFNQRFRRWVVRRLKEKSDKDHWTRRWQAETDQDSAADTGRSVSEAGPSREESLATPAGQYALKHGFGARWFDALENQPQLRSLEETKRQQKALTETRLAEDDPLYEMLTNAQRDREQAFTDKYLAVA